MKATVLPSPVKSSVVTVSDPPPPETVDQYVVPLPYVVNTCPLVPSVLAYATAPAVTFPVDVIIPAVPILPILAFQIGRAHV